MPARLARIRRRLHRLREGQVDVVLGVNTWVPRAKGLYDPKVWAHVPCRPYTYYVGTRSILWCTWGGPGKSGSPVLYGFRRWLHRAFRSFTLGLEAVSQKGWLMGGLKGVLHGFSRRAADQFVPLWGPSTPSSLTSLGCYWLRRSKDPA